MWAASYMGIPFKPFGRDRHGCDCWGLVRLVYAERRSITLPDFEGVSPDDAAAIPAAIEAERPGWRPVPPEERQEFDVVVMRARLVVDGKGMAPEMHVGIVTSDRKVLHTQLPFGVACVPFDHPTLVNRIAGIYRR